MPFMGATETWSHTERLGGARLLFAGRGAAPTPSETLAKYGVEDVGCARLNQVHSAEVLTARNGLCGDGDALVTRDLRLALAVVTADCLPVVLAGATRLAVVHAGWRGLVAGVLTRAVERLGPEPEGLSAWIGPSIGPCCYEVGMAVGRSVATTLDVSRRAEVLHSVAGGNPRLDLALTARYQLDGAGVGDVAIMRLCTHCRPDLLWSYRREGAEAGRNHTLAWLTG